MFNFYTFNQQQTPMIRDQKDIMLQNEEKQLRKKSFKCLKCSKYAQHPVLTRCGHIFCWQCLYRNFKRINACPYCKQQCNVNECYPVYTDHHQQQQASKQQQQQTHSQNQLSSDEIDNNMIIQPISMSQQIPPRPTAKQRARILNPNMIGAGLPLASNNLPSNVNMGKLIAGQVFMSPLGVNSLNSIQQGRQNDIDYAKGQKIKLKMHIAIIFTILIMVYCFLG